MYRLTRGARYWQQLPFSTSKLNFDTVMIAKNAFFFKNSGPRLWQTQLLRRAGAQGLIDFFVFYLRLHLKTSNENKNSQSRKFFISKADLQLIKNKNRYRIFFRPGKLISIKIIAIKFKSIQKLYRFDLQNYGRLAQKILFKILQLLRPCILCCGHHQKSDFYKKTRLI